MKTIQGNLIHLAQNGELDLIVHGCNCICMMEAGGDEERTLNIERQTLNIEWK